MHLVIGTTVVRVIGSYDDPEVAAAVAARLNQPVDNPPALPLVYTEPKTSSQEIVVEDSAAETPRVIDLMVALEAHLAPFRVNPCDL